MATVNFYQPRPQFFDQNGNPLSFGRVVFYYPGTSTLKEVYTDVDATVPAQNPHPLDVEGYITNQGLYLGDGDYKVSLESSDGAGGFIEEWTVDPVRGGAILTSGVVDSAIVDNIAALKGLTPGSFEAVYVLGYYEEGDSGGGWFTWDPAAVDAEDAGSVITPAGDPATGRWFRVFDADQINAAQWGAMPSAPSTVDSLLLAMMDFANANPEHSTAIIPGGDLNISGSFSLTGDVDLIIQGGARFVCSNIATITITSRDAKVSGNDPIVNGNVTIAWFPQSQRDANIGWWGNGAWPTWERAVGNYNGRLIIDKDYNLTSAVYNTNVIFDNLYFEKDGALAIPDTGAQVFRIIKYDTADEMPRIFRGSGFKEYLRWGGDQWEFKAQHFFDTGTVASTDYEDVIYNLTENGARSKPPRLIWGFYQEWVLPFDFDDPQRTIEMDVEQGTLIIFDDAGGLPTWFGTIISPAERRIFAGSATSVPLVQNQEISAGWWGLSAQSNSQGSNRNNGAIDRAFTCAIVNNTWVTLNGVKATIDDNFSYFGSGELKVKDGVIILADSFTEPVAIETTTSLYLKGVSVLCPETNEDNTTLVRVYASGANEPGFTKIEECRFLPSLFEPSNLGLDVATSNDISTTYIRNSNFTGKIRLSNDTTILDSTFSNGPVEFFRQNPSKVKIHGCTFTTTGEDVLNIDLFANVNFSGAGIASDIYITSNEFLDLHTGTAIPFLKFVNVRSLVDSGHLNCVVKDNRQQVGTGGNNLGLASTEVYLDYSGTVIKSSSIVLIPTSSTGSLSPLILKRSSRPFEIANSTLRVDPGQIASSQGWVFPVVNGANLTYRPNDNTATLEGVAYTATVQYISNFYQPGT